MVSHTFSPQADRRAEAVGATAALLAALVAVVVFLPSDGRVLVPFHQTLDALLGSATFVIPLGLLLASIVAFARRRQPQVALPKRRLVGLALITIGLLPAERLLGQSTGLVGEWFTGFLLELFGTPLATLFTAALMGLGIVLTFNIRRRRRPIAAR